MEHVIYVQSTNWEIDRHNLPLTRYAANEYEVRIDCENS